MGKKNVKLTLTSKNGCTVEINGTVEYSIIPPSIDGFSGTVTISGGQGCPNGTLNFRTAGRGSGAEHLKVTFDKEDIFKVSNVIWHGRGPVTAILNERKINKALYHVMRSVPVVNIRAID